MDPKQPSRLISEPTYPKDVYVESVALFLGANYLYHRNVFRRSNNKWAFSAFLLVNAFTSYNLVEVINPRSLNYYAALYNNDQEYKHRAKLQEKLRLKILGRQWSAEVSLI